MIKTLVILTTHFGTNFSGGSTATCEIFSRLEANFKEVIVIGNKLGLHPFKSVKFINYTSWRHAIKIVKDIKSERTIFYGDFYNAIIFVWLKIPFFFTYHDNWPELGTTSFQNGIRSTFYTNIYKQIFKHAIAVFSVSAFKSAFIRKFSKQVHLIRNGFNMTVKTHFEEAHSDILMVGTIDDRKYRLAIPLFRLLQKEKNNNLSIDIYGNVEDQKLRNKLNSFPFVTLKSFSEYIPYQSYKILLHTSLMENLPMVYCEAIYHGIPVIGFDVGGASEIVTSITGVLIPPYHIDKMKEELLKLIVNPKKPADGNKISKEFSWGKASTDYLKQMV